jgi:threonine/homoserine/homoserine lactone efflux protein
MDELIPIATLSIFMTASIALLLTPGPAVMYVVTRSIDQGRKAGLISVLGIEVGGLFHALAATLGLSAILLSSALAFDIVKYLGAAYLIFIGIRTLLTKPEVETQVVERKSLWRIFSQGVVVNVLNPKTALFFFAFLPQFVDPARGSSTLQFLILGLIFVGLAALTDGMYAILAGSAAHWLRENQRFLRWRRYFSGPVYIGLGLTAALATRTDR